MAATKGAAIAVDRALVVARSRLSGQGRPFIERLVRWSAEQDTPWHLDYWRLNLIGRRPTRDPSVDSPLWLGWNVILYAPSINGAAPENIGAYETSYVSLIPSLVAASNAGVRRYETTPDAANYLERYYQPSGTDALVMVTR